jgi:aspartate racemase
LSPAQAGPYVREGQELTKVKNPEARHNRAMTLHIGIAACSAEGAALCYRTICTEGPALLGRAHDHPEVSVHTPPLPQYMEAIYRDDWEAVADLMLASARKLRTMGADFVICPDNTLHQAFARVAPRSPLPWLHIAEAVAAEAAARGFRRPGLLGTRWLVLGPVYPAHYVRPEPAEREELNRIIMEELVCGIFRPEALAFHQRVIARMKQAGCDAVVLGCTEIPLLVDDSSSPLPTLDSTRLLARAALRRAVEAGR